VDYFNEDIQLDEKIINKDIQEKEVIDEIKIQDDDSTEIIDT
jgi:hypothetical protein